MRKIDYLSLGILVLVGAAASSAAVTGCGGDDSGTSTDGGGADTGSEDATTGTDGTSPIQGSDATTPIDDDSGQPAKGEDSGAPDTGVDAGHHDAGVDSGEPDTGVDSGQPDSGQPDTGAPDTGVDSSPPDTGAPDTGADSSEPDAGTDSGGSDDGGVSDASDDASSGDASDASAIGFANPIQIDVSSILNANAVVTTATGGLTLTPMDGTDPTERNDFPTQSEATALNDAGAGLPDFASFAGDGVSIPHVQLAWTNAANVKNSLVVLGSAGTVYSFSVPPAKYNQVQVYATGGSGGSTLDVTFTYTGSSGTTTATTTMPVPDWCVPGILNAGEYKLVSVDRVQAAIYYSPGLCNIYAIDLGPDSSQVLTQVSFSDNGTSGNYLVFYGATAW